MHIFVNSSEIKKGPLLLNCFENLIETHFLSLSLFKNRQRGGVLAVA